MHGIFKLSDLEIAINLDGTGENNLWFLFNSEWGCKYISATSTCIERLLTCAAPLYIHIHEGFQGYQTEGSLSFEFNGGLHERMKPHG